MVYSTPLQVLEESGIQQREIQENVGTGDNSNLDFSLTNQRVIADTYSLYFASSTTSNDFTNLTETTDYTLDKDKGKIRLTATGRNNLSTNILFADYVWCEPFTSDEVVRAVVKADAEIDLTTGRKWSTPVSFVQEFDFLEEKEASDYSIYQKTEDGTSDRLGEDYVVVDFLPLASITSIKFYNQDGTEDTDEALGGSDSDDYPENYEFYNYGKIVFKNKSIGTGYKKIKITGTYGQSTTSVLAQELSAIMASMRLYLNLSGGSYNDVTSYSMGGVSVSVGEPYINIREFLAQSSKRVSEILALLGRRHNIVGT